jgi:hypothetical protein
MKARASLWSARDQASSRGPELIAFLGASVAAIGALLAEVGVVVEKPWLLDPLQGASYNARLDVHEELALRGHVVATAGEESEATIEDIQGYGRRRDVRRAETSRAAAAQDAGVDAPEGGVGVLAAKSREWDIVRDGYTINVSGVLPSGRQIALALTPTVHPDAPFGNVRWACGYNRPAGWVELGPGGVTSVPPELLIRPCRARKERTS